MYLKLYVEAAPDLNKIEMSPPREGWTVRSIRLRLTPVGATAAMLVLSITDLITFALHGPLLLHTK